MVKKRSWNEKQLRLAVRQARSIRQILHALHLREAGGNYFQIKKYLSEYNISTAHLKGQGWCKGLKGIGKPKIPLEKILIRDSNFQSYKLKARLFKAGLKRRQCEECGWKKTSPDGRIPLELDHVNGNGRDNRLENLRILCPNCHSLQSTHRGLNIQQQRARVVKWQTLDT